MGGVSDVLAQGSLVAWTLRHELGHAVELGAGWEILHAGKEEFGGWRTHDTPKKLRAVAVAFLDKVGIEGDEQLVRDLAELIQRDEASNGPDLQAIESIPAKLAHGDTERHAKLTTLTGHLKAAMAQPWTLDDGGIDDVGHDGRIYQVTHDTGQWVSYHAPARAHAVSNYQFATPDEWFAEAYAAFHDPRTVNSPRERLHPAVRDWFAAEESGSAPQQNAAPGKPRSAGQVQIDVADINNRVILKPGTGISTGRSFHTPEEEDERLLVHTDLDLRNRHFAHFDPARQQGSQYTVLPTDLAPVPWQPEDDLYLLLLHGEKGWLTVPVNGKPVHVSPQEFARTVINRRDSIVELKRRAGKNAWLVLAACEAGAVDKDGKSVAQTVADETRMKVAAPTTVLNAIPGKKDFSFLVHPDADGNRGAFQVFHPSHAASSSGDTVTQQTDEGPVLVPPTVINAPLPVTQSAPRSSGTLQQRLDAMAAANNWGSLEAITFAGMPRELTVGGTHGTLASVPQDLHFIWVGGRMEDATLENLRTWVARAAGSGWTVNLWLDASAQAANGPLLTGELSAIAVRSIDDATLYDRLPEAVRDKVRALAGFSVSRGAYFAASDIIRFALLWHYGGAYLDVDIAPGDFTLPKSPLQMAVDGPNLPLMAPMLRDHAVFERVRGHLRDAGLPLGTTIADQMESVARYRYARGDYNGNLLVTPPRSAFLEHAFAQLPDPEVPAMAPEEDYTSWLGQHATKLFQFQNFIDASSALTGPEFLVNAAREYAKNFDVPTDAEFRPLNVELRDQWLPLQWITDESDISAAETTPVLSSFPPLSLEQQAKLTFQIRSRRGLLAPGRRVGGPPPLDQTQLLRTVDVVSVHDHLYADRRGGDRDLSVLVSLRRLAEVIERRNGSTLSRFTVGSLDTLVHATFGTTTVTDDHRRLLVDTAQKAKRRGHPLTVDALTAAAGATGTTLDVSELPTQSAPPVRSEANTQSDDSVTDDAGLAAWNAERREPAYFYRDEESLPAAIAAITDELEAAGPGSGSMVMVASGDQAFRLYAGNVDGSVFWTSYGDSTRYPADQLPLPRAGHGLQHRSEGGRQDAQAVRRPARPGRGRGRLLRSAVRDHGHAHRPAHRAAPPRRGDAERHQDAVPRRRGAAAAVHPRSRRGVGRGVRGGQQRGDRSDSAGAAGLRPRRTPVPDGRVRHRDLAGRPPVRQAAAAARPGEGHAARRDRAPEPGHVRHDRRRRRRSAVADSPELGPGGRTHRGPPARVRIPPARLRAAAAGRRADAGAGPEG